jgi:flagellar basal body-associated protein FliL
MNWLKYLLGFSALIVAGCAAYFSVTGLGVLFSGATLSVMIMAGALEFAKLVAATYLKQKWDIIHGFNKIYLTISVAVLMIITSAGIFGYLSNAFQAQNLKIQQVEREIAVWDSKIKQSNEQITQLSEQSKQYNQNQGKILDNGKVNNRVLRSIDNRDTKIAEINGKIGVLQDSVLKYNEKINQIKTDNIELEREVGGFRFVAESFGWPLNTVVKFFIILIVCVFDPLAIALIIAFNGLISEKRKEDDVEMVEKPKLYEVYGEQEKIVENISEKPEEIPVIVENSLPKERIIQSDNQEPEFIPNPEEIKPKAYYEEPDFDWSNKSRWIADKRARMYYDIHIKPNRYPTDFSSKTY